MGSLKKENGFGTTVVMVIAIRPSVSLDIIIIGYQTLPHVTVFI